MLVFFGFPCYTRGIAVGMAAASRRGLKLHHTDARHESTHRRNGGCFPSGIEIVVATLTWLW